METREEKGGRLPYSARICRDLEANRQAPEYTYWTQFHVTPHEANQSFHKACKREFADLSYLQEVVLVPREVWDARSCYTDAERHGAAKRSANTVLAKPQSYSEQAAAGGSTFADALTTKPEETIMHNWKDTPLITCDRQDILRDSFGYARRNCKSTADYISSWLLDTTNGQMHVIRNASSYPRPVHEHVRVQTDDGRVRKFTYRRLGDGSEIISYHGITPKGQTVAA